MLRATHVDREAGHHVRFSAGGRDALHRRGTLLHLDEGADIRRRPMGNIERRRIRRRRSPDRGPERRRGRGACRQRRQLRLRLLALCRVPRAAENLQACWRSHRGRISQRRVPKAASSDVAGGPGFGDPREVAGERLLGCISPATPTASRSRTPGSSRSTRPA